MRFMNGLSRFRYGVFMNENGVLYVILCAVVYVFFVVVLHIFLYALGL